MPRKKNGSSHTRRDSNLPPISDKRQHRAEVRKHDVLPGYIARCYTCSWSVGMLDPDADRLVREARLHSTVGVVTLAEGGRRRVVAEWTHSSILG